MDKPSAEFQLQFLDYIQRLLDEGEFVASYKYALLMALADLSVEKGDDSSASLCLHAKDVAIKFIQYYSRQAIPFQGFEGAEPTILHQNSGNQAAIVKWVSEASPLYDVRGIQLATKLLQKDKKLVGKVTSNVAIMPLWKLQTIARSVDDFLYENIGNGREFELRPGIPFCFRKFHSFIVRLAQEGWVRFIRERQQNHHILGQTSDLSHFMFGVNRSSLMPYRELLADLQQGKCFYCLKGKTATHVDHFIPWSWYNLDLGHNFVLTCKACNSKKRDMLAAPKHLDSWLDRNSINAGLMKEYFDSKCLPNDKDSSLFITKWAYERVARSNGHTWVKKEKYQKLGAFWSFPKFED